MDATENGAFVMKTVYICMRLLIFIVSIGLLFMDCNRKKDANYSKVSSHQVILSEVVDDVPLPPPGLVTNFKNLQEWLSNVSSLEQPKMPIASYDFGLFESSDANFTVFVVGLNKSGDNDHSISHIDFEPLNMYFQLPKREYGNLDNEQVMNKVKAQLRDFINTKKFKSSFFAQAKSITVNSGDEIWAK